MKFIRNLFFIALVFTLTTCDNLFEYSVYSADVKSEQKNTTAKNLALLEDIIITEQDFKFAFVTDVHYSYNNLRTVIEDINKRDDVLFVVFGGDIADQALLKEFEIFYDIMQNLNKPYFTVIGNHDYNSEGSLIYSRMFGDFNYSFVFNNNKFVLFDDIIWESNKDPDFDWLANELSDHADYNQIFAFAHIPTYVSRDLTEEMRTTYESIMENSNVSLSLHGHTHSYFYKEDVVDYLIVPSLKDPVYATVQVTDKDFNVELIEL